MNVRIAKRMAGKHYEPSEEDLTAYRETLDAVREQSLARKATEHVIMARPFAPCVYRVGNGRRLRKSLCR